MRPLATKKFSFANLPKFPAALEQLARHFAAIPRVGQKQKSPQLALEALLVLLQQNKLAET